MTKIDEDVVMRLATDATMRAVGDGAVILMVKSGQMYSCNETAREFLERLDGVRNVMAVADGMAGEYDVARDVLMEDLSELLGYLLDEGVLIVAG